MSDRNKPLFESEDGVPITVVRVSQASFDATAAEAAIGPLFICPRCGAASHHPTDAAEGYCGRCHAYTAEPGRPWSPWAGTEPHDG